MKKNTSSKGFAPFQWLKRMVIGHSDVIAEEADLAVVPREKPHTGAAAREQPRDSPVIER